ncbi:MAG: hypothetical protein M3N39_03180 [Pseudomonadota bacterium]|nr:hypothetical protein [Pseudomonadota bacterium]
MTLSIFALWLLSSVAAAQTRPDRHCLDDTGVNRCAEKQQRDQRQRYDAQAIEVHAARGEQVRRVFYVDGYGSDLALISFVRAPGRDIELEVRTPRAPGAGVRTLTAAVPLSHWQEVIASSRQFDRALVPRPSAVPNLCMHSWVYTAEASDPPLNGQTRPSIRRAVEDACQDGLVQPFALGLAQHALDLLPPCRVITPEQHRNAVAILAACTRLSGDRIAAAQVMNALRTMGFGNHPELTREMRAGFGHRVRFNINGQVTEHDWGGAAPFWLQQRQALGAWFIPESYHGERSDRVLVRGHLWRSAKGQQPAQRAPMEIVMGWEPAQMFLIQEIKVGAFAPSR